MDKALSYKNRVTSDNLLITLGLICAGIGTSPLYVMNAVIGEQVITDNLVMGTVSAVFWALTLQATFKYMILTLRADNKGEGGIFSLYTLVKRTRFKWLLAPAIIGGSALLADGVISPAISISAAVEGVWFYDKKHTHFRHSNCYCVCLIFSYSNLEIVLWVVCLVR